MSDDKPKTIPVPPEILSRMIITLGACAVAFAHLNFTGPIDDIMQVLKDVGLPEDSLESIRKRMKEKL